MGTGGQIWRPLPTLHDHAAGTDVPAAPVLAPVVTGSSYGRRHSAGADTNDGTVMHWVGWSHPLEDYVAVLTSAGLAVVEFGELLWINAAHRP